MTERAPHLTIINGRYIVEPWTGNWWALALRAVAAILFGIVAFALPGATVAALVLVFAVYAFADGVLSIIAAIRGVRKHERWGGMLAQGIAGVIAGLIAFFFPALGALGFVYLVAAWALVTGTLEITAAITLRKQIQGEWMLILSGALSVLFGILVALMPGVGIVVLAWWLGAYALAYGVIGIALSLRVRKRTHAHAV
jgi:uncharacterized membrane protein HdeD (DUF308 family)